MAADDRQWIIDLVPDSTQVRVRALKGCFRRANRSAANRLLRRIFAHCGGNPIRSRLVAPGIVVIMVVGFERCHAATPSLCHGKPTKPVPPSRRSSSQSIVLQARPLRVAW